MGLRTWFSTTVASITANLSKIVAQLEAHVNFKKEEEAFHNGLAKLAQEEHVLAERIRAKLAEILS